MNYKLIESSFISANFIKRLTNGVIKVIHTNVWKRSRACGTIKAFIIIKRAENDLQRVVSCFTLLFILITMSFFFGFVLLPDHEIHISIFVAERKL